MAFTVKAQQSGTTAVGSAMYVLVLTGAAAVQPGAVGGSSTRSSASLSQTLTPTGTGSFVYASILSLTTSGTLSPLSGQSIPYQPSSGGLNYSTVTLTSGTTTGSNVTIGATNTSNTAISIAAAEILQASGKTLTVDASSPGGFTSGNIFVTSSSFTPPNGSLIMVAVQTNGGSGTVFAGMTDTSGLGLTWVEQIRENAANNGYVGIWTTRMPSGATTSTPGITMMGVG